MSNGQVAAGHPHLFAFAVAAKLGNPFCLLVPVVGLVPAGPTHDHGVAQAAPHHRADRLHVAQAPPDIGREARGLRHGHNEVGCRFQAKEHGRFIAELRKVDFVPVRQPVACRRLRRTRPRGRSRCRIENRGVDDAEALLISSAVPPRAAVRVRCAMTWSANSPPHPMVAGNDAGRDQEYARIAPPI